MAEAKLCQACGHSEHKHSLFYPHHCIECPARCGAFSLEPEALEVFRASHRDQTDEMDVTEVQGAYLAGFLSAFLGDGPQLTFRELRGRLEKLRDLVVKRDTEHGSCQRTEARLMAEVKAQQALSNELQSKLIEASDKLREARRRARAAEALAAEARSSVAKLQRSTKARKA